MPKIITLSESDINRIIKRVINENHLIYEQELNSEGMYRNKYEHILIGVNSSKKTYKIPKNGQFSKIGNNVHLGVTGLYLPCDFKGYDYIFIDGKDDNFMYKENQEPGKTWLSKTLRKLFCSKNKSTNSKPVSQKPKTDTRCKFTEMSFQAKNLCKLPNDKVWSYVKTDDGKWYTSKQSDMKKWCELTPSKFAKAIDILTKGCKTTEEIPSLKLKPIGPIQIDKKLEIVPSNQEMMNKGMEGLENIQDFQNQPV